jgi:hypothetical protein
MLQLERYATFFVLFLENTERNRYFKMRQHGREKDKNPDG